MIEPRSAYQPYHRPPVPGIPAKPGLPAGLIALLVLGGVGMLGAGVLAAAGAVWYFVGQRADAVATAEPSLDGGVDAAAAGVADSEEASAGPVEEAEQPRVEAAETRAREPSTARPSGESPVASGTDGTKAVPQDVSWRCTASASVRVCGFAGACNYQMVFGNGFGKDRFLASQQAKHACQASARAKGATAVCIVQCSAR